MKKVISLVAAFMMAATIFCVPVTGTVYAQDNGEPSAEVTSIDISSEDVTVTADKEIKYTGKEITPVPVVKYGEVTLVSGIDYTVAYENNINAGTAYIIITGQGQYNGTKNVPFEITPASISKAKISLSYSNYSYTGKKRTPAPKVELNGTVLKKNTDYKVSYTNNLYPGTAKVTVTGTGNYAGTVNKSFYIAKIGSVSLKSRGVEQLKLAWPKKEGVSGYQVWRYNSSKGKWGLWKTTEGDSAITTVKKLAAGTTYKFKVRAFVKDSSGTKHYGAYSDVLTTATKPGKVTFSSLSTNVKLQLKVKWKKKTGSGYQIYVSRNSDFSNPSKYYVKSSSTLSKPIQVSKNNKYYYVKVRAYKTIGGKKVYGAWSSTKKIKTKNTGWGTFSGRKYYYKDGIPLKGQQTIGGSKYYFGANTGVLVGTNKEMYNETKNEKSGTKYLLAVDRRANRVCVYHKDGGEWVVKYYWKCSTGMPNDYSTISCTPSGKYTVPETRTHMKYFGDKEGYRCWYATRIKGPYYFHSIKYYPGSITRIMDGRLGYNISHGCIRMHIDNAKWIYDNIHAGTKVVILK